MYLPEILSVIGFCLSLVSMNHLYENLNVLEKKRLFFPVLVYIREYLYFVSNFTLHNLSYPLYSYHLPFNSCVFQCLCILVVCLSSLFFRSHLCVGEDITSKMDGTAECREDCADDRF